MSAGAETCLNVGCAWYCRGILRRRLLESRWPYLSLSSLIRWLRRFTAVFKGMDFLRVEAEVVVLLRGEVLAEIVQKSAASSQPIATSDQLPWIV